MAVVFDEVVGDVHPDDANRSEAAARDIPASPADLDIDELRRAVERARRRDARLAAD